MFVFLAKKINILQHQLYYMFVEYYVNSEVNSINEKRALSCKNANTLRNENSFFIIILKIRYCDCT